MLVVEIYEIKRAECCCVVNTNLDNLGTLERWKAKLFFVDRNTEA